MMYDYPDFPRIRSSSMSGDLELILPERRITSQTVCQNEECSRVYVENTINDK